MGKRILTAIAIASVFLTASPASADYRERIYVTTLYSDSTYTEAVGSIYPQCGPNNAVYQLSGTYTQYSGEPEWVGWCTANGPEYV
jgi:hypothetical protein